MIEVGTGWRAAWGSAVMRETVEGRGLWTAGRRHFVRQTPYRSSEGRAYSDGTGLLLSSEVAGKPSAVAQGTAGIVAGAAAEVEAAYQKDLCHPSASQFVAA